VPEPADGVECDPGEEGARREIGEAPSPSEPIDPDDAGIGRRVEGIEVVSAERAAGCGQPTLAASAM